MTPPPTSPPPDPDVHATGLAILRERHGRPNLVLADYFDLIGGTSTGAIIATTLALEWRVRDVVDLYSRRFTIEETFRDQKDPRFGFGMRHTRVASPDRRDRLLLLASLAQALLTLLGAAGERCGLDRVGRGDADHRARRHRGDAAHAARGGAGAVYAGAREHGVAI